jgi:26S proteasome regulatory subunit N3
MVVVQLLMGEVPERAVFLGGVLRGSVGAYLSITSAVKTGDLQTFQKTLIKHTELFQAHKTYTLIVRLRHNVIKTGIRMLSVSYSRISLRDTCVKLQLDSEEDAEYVVGKAIRDGVVDARIDHVGGWMKSRETVDTYSTNEPQVQFHQRISYCLGLYNESVQAMRYPMNNPKADSVELQEALSEEKKLAKEIVEGDEDGDDMEF